MNVSTKAFRIEGMHCSSCAMSIDWALEDVSGVQEASTSYVDSQTTVTFDPEVVSDEAITAAIKEAGFGAHPMG